MGVRWLLQLTLTLGVRLATASLSKSCAVSSVSLDGQFYRVNADCASCALTGAAGNGNFSATQTVTVVRAGSTVYSGDATILSNDGTQTYSPGSCSNGCQLTNQYHGRRDPGVSASWQVGDIVTYTDGIGCPLCGSKSPIFTHRTEEVYVQTALVQEHNCMRGTIRSRAAASGLPTGSDPYTVSLEFKCDPSSDPGGGEDVSAGQNLYSWGHLLTHAANSLILRNDRLRHVWGAPGSGDTLDWSYASSNKTLSDICDGTWHTVSTQSDGTTRRLVFDGVTVRSDTPTTAAHAESDKHFCIGADGETYVRAFVGSIRNFEIFSGGLTCYASPRIAVELDSSAANLTGNWTSSNASSDQIPGATSASISCGSCQRGWYTSPNVVQAGPGPGAPTHHPTPPFCPSRT